MNAREVRYLCRVGRDDMTQLGKLLIVAKNCNLVLGKVVTTSSSFYSSILSANQGDIVLELVGKLGTNRDALLKAVNVPSLSSVEAVIATAQEIEVHLLIFLHLQIVHNGQLPPSVLRMPSAAAARRSSEAKIALCA